MLKNITAKEVFSIPNIISYIRIALIPVFIDLYYDEQYGAAFAVLVASFFSDGIDGFIARRFNMITELGKALDPVADKLSQTAVVFCACKNVPEMFWLLAVHMTKEFIMGILSTRLYKKTGHIYGARWFGKWCTGLIYTTSAVMLVWRGMPQPIASLLVAVCVAFVLFCLWQYAALYRRMHIAHSEGGSEAAQQEFNRVRER